MRLLDGLSHEKRRKIYDLAKMIAIGPTEKPAIGKPVRPPSRDRRGLLVKDSQGGGFLHVAPVGSVPPSVFDGASQRSNLLLGPTGAIIGVKIGRYTRL